MKPLKSSLAVAVALAAMGGAAILTTPMLSSAADQEMAMPATPAEHADTAAKYDQEATALDARAAEHDKLAAQYRARLTGAGKREPAIRSLINHCERLAKAYREAAKEARDMAQSHREMSGTP